MLGGDRELTIPLKLTESNGNFKNWDVPIWVRIIGEGGYRGYAAFGTLLALFAFINFV